MTRKINRSTNHQAVDNGGKGFVANVLNASLTLMAILVAVITILAVEYKTLAPHPTFAQPIWAAVVGSALVAALSGGLALAALIHLRTGHVSPGVLAWSFGVLIAAMIVLIVYVVIVFIG